MCLAYGEEMLIGLAGNKRAGKDSAYKYIRDKHDDPRRPVERLAFADPLKEVTTDILGINGHPIDEMESFKTFGYVDIHHDNSLPRRWVIKGRDFLVRLGEVHKRVFGQDFWVDLCLPRDSDHRNQIWIVTDVRHPNEAQRVLDLGGEVWHIIRRPQEGRDDSNIPPEMITRTLTNSSLEAYHRQIDMAFKMALTKAKLSSKKELLRSR
jgi:hypothetical protein